VNKSEVLRWVARQWERLNGFQVSAECCESLARMDVREETIPDSESC